MSRFFWILIGLLGLALVALIASGDSGKVLGIESGRFAALASGALMAAFIGSAVFGRGIKLGDTAKQMAIWVLIIVGLMSGYVFRYDLQDFASRFSGGVFAGSPIASQNADGRNEVTLIRSRNGHFEANAGVNGETVRFLIDTGATGIVLSAQDAQNAGINSNDLQFTIPVNTANGRAFVASTTIENLYLGGIERKNLRVTVAQPGRLNQSLLGQQFLESLSSYEKRGDRLTLRD